MGIDITLRQHGVSSWPEREHIEEILFFFK